MTNSTPSTESNVDETVNDVASPVASDTPDGTSTETPIELDPLEQAVKERDEYLDDLRRQRAEFENYRKRVAYDATVQRTAGRNDTVSALLEFADDLDRLTAAAADETSGRDDLARAVELLESKWRHALRSLQVERIEATGVPFDPTEHDAVSQIPADSPVEEPIVSEIMRVGYRSNDRVLRPAMVVVAQ